MDVHTFDRLVNNEIGGMGAFLKGKVRFDGNIFQAIKFEKEIIDVYWKGANDKKFGGEV